MLRTLVIGIAGLLLAGFVLIAYVSMQSPPKAGPKPVAVKTVAVIATAHPVRAGSLLQPNDLAVRNVPEDKIPPGAQRDSTQARNALVGAMVRRMLDDHEIIAGNDVLRPGDRGFLAAVLAPGARAISVAVDAVSGEAGLIWPGDRVDLILTQTIENSDQSMAHRVSGETVLADVRVIAVDQQLVQGGQATGLIDGHGPTSRTITLEVSAHDAERVAVATRLGKPAGRAALGAIQYGRAGYAATKGRRPAYAHPGQSLAARGRRAGLGRRRIARPRRRPRGA